MGKLSDLVEALRHFPQDKPVVIRHNGEDHEHEAALIWDEGDTVVIEIDKERKQNGTNRTE